MIYIYPEQNLRVYPGAIRGTEKWDSIYITVIVADRLHKHQYLHSLKPLNSVKLSVS